MRFAALLSALLMAPLPGWAQPRAAGGPCREACERYVKEAPARGKVCGRCLLGELDRGAWVAALVEQDPNSSALGEMLSDDDWAVRWGAVRGQAKVRGVTELRQLATWVVEAKSGSAVLACETAVHVAGEKKEAAGPVLTRGGAMGPSAAALCWQKREVLRDRLEKQLYSQTAFERREALRHLAAFFSNAPARVALDAMKDRPPQGDGILATLLLEEAQGGGPPVGRGLISAVHKDESALADRLLAQWAPKVDAERANLISPDETVRRAAVSELSNLGPLGAHELEAALGDDSMKVALAAARALARGEGMNVTAMARKQLSPEGKGSEALKLKWVELLGRSQEKDCAALLPKLLADERNNEPLRAAALVAWAACSGQDALPALKPLLTSKSPMLRAAAVDALGEMPRVAQAPELVTQAFKDPEPHVQAAAARAAGGLRLTARAAALVAMLETGGPEVRLAAAQALTLLRTPQGAGVVARVLGQDTDPAVRLACVGALAEVGGPEALGALGTAAKNDASPKVKVAAQAALRRLGFEPSQGTLRP